MMMDPGLRKRFIGSIDYLRRMGFFQDYSNLTSEEILERIFSGNGKWLEESIEEHEDSWAKVPDSEIDVSVLMFDNNRVMVQYAEAMVGKGLGISILKRLEAISRGIFQPTDIREEWIKTDMEFGSEWQSFKVSFKFRNKTHNLKIALHEDYLKSLGLKKINGLIKDTGYQYYEFSGGDMMDIKIVVLTKEEKEKLKRERGWKFLIEKPSEEYGFIREIEK